MVAAFPAAKLGFLLIKQISKPIANGIAGRARKSKLFREYICIPVAQFFHWYDVKVRMRVLNLGKVTSVPKLDEKKAIETGSQLLSEFILLAIGGGIVIFEYRRQSEKEEVKTQVIEQEKAEARDQVTNLELTVARQSVQIKELTRLTIAIRDDLQKVANATNAVAAAAAASQNDKKSGGFFGGGGKASSEGDASEKPLLNTTVPSIPESLQFDDNVKDVHIADVACNHAASEFDQCTVDIGPITQTVRRLNLHAA